MRNFIALALLLCSVFNAAVVANAKETGEKRTVDLTYTFTISELPKDADSITAWIPFPAETSVQRVHGFSVNTAFPVSLITADDYGNRFLQFDLSGVTGQRTIDVTYRVTRWAYRADGAASDMATANVERWLNPNSLVPIDGMIAAEASQVAGMIDTPFAAAEALFDHIVETMEYDKSGEGWGRGDAIFACTEREGNCTDFHSLFIGEARSLAIPARFLMGIPLPPTRGAGEIGGYHCWAEFHDSELGWVPVDASEVRKHPEQRELLFAGLDENRIEFTLGRDLVVPGSSPDTHSFFIYPYVEVDGEQWDDVSKDFSYRDI